MQAPEILTDMLGGVQGVAQPRGYDTYIYPTAAYYPSVTPINGVNNPNLCPNEISEPPTEQVYIRAIGSTTGTLDRMKRIVHKQRSFYGINLFLLWLKSKNAEMLRFRSGLTQSFFTESIMDQGHARTSNLPGKRYNLQKIDQADVCQSHY